MIHRQTRDDTERLQAAARIRTRCTATPKARALTDCVPPDGAPLLPRAKGRDVREARAALGEVAGLMRSPRAQGADVDYQCVLGCLARLVADLLRGAGHHPLPLMAADYAAVVAMIGRHHPELDYDTNLGQLLEMLGTLVRAEHPGWRPLHRRLHEIASAVGAGKALGRLFAADIHQWFHAGIQDLFEYRGRVASVVNELSAQIEAVESDIRMSRGELADLRCTLTGYGNSRIAVFEEKRKERDLAALEERLAGLREDLARKERTLALIEADVRDFDDRLYRARRALLLRAV
jgi:hypothetical protein